MSKPADLAALVRTDIKPAIEVFVRGKHLDTVIRDAAYEAMKVLYDGLTHRDDKLRLASAQALINAHVKMASIKAQPQGNTISNAELPFEEKVNRLVAALRSPPPELQQALKIIKADESDD